MNRHAVSTAKAAASASRARRSSPEASFSAPERQESIRTGSRLRIDSARSGAENEASGDDRLAVRPKGGGRVFGGDSVPVHSFSCCVADRVQVDLARTRSIPIKGGPSAQAAP